MKGILSSGICLWTSRVSLHILGEFISDAKIDTRDANPIRVFVERAPGVRDNESVMRWIAH